MVEEGNKGLFFLINKANYKTGSCGFKGSFVYDFGNDEH